MVPHLSKHLGRVEHVIRGWGDVDVAQPDNRLVGPVPLAQHPAKPIEPSKLVLPLIASNRVAVGDIRVDECDPVEFARQHAGILWKEVVDEADYRIRGRCFGKRGNPVPRFLAVQDEVVTELLKLVERKLVVLDLGLLDGEQIRFMLGEPLGHDGKAGAHGCGIECRDDHTQTYQSRRYSSSGTRDWGVQSSSRVWNSACSRFDGSCTVNFKDFVLRIAGTTGKLATYTAP